MLYQLSYTRVASSLDWVEIASNAKSRSTLLLEVCLAVPFESTDHYAEKDDAAPRLASLPTERYGVASSLNFLEFRGIMEVRNLASPGSFRDGPSLL
jgi:hypothetical protein